MVLLTLDFTPMNQTCKNGYKAKCFHVYFITKIFKRFTPSKKLIPVYILKTKNGLKNNYNKKRQTYQLYYLKMTQITRENKLANNCYISILCIIISQYHSASPHLKTCGWFPSKKTEPITLKAELNSCKLRGLCQKEEGASAAGLARQAAACDTHTPYRSWLESQLLHS